jgi:hypothetical protein
MPFTFDHKWSISRTAIFMVKTIVSMSDDLSLWPTWCTNLYYTYYNTLHVWSNILLILRRSNCINTASGIVTVSKWPFSAQVEKELQFFLNLCTEQSLTESDNTRYCINPFQSNFSANRILPSSYLFWAGKRLVDYLFHLTVLKEKNTEKQKKYNLRYLLAKVRTTWEKASDRLQQRANKRNKNRVGRLPTSEQNRKIILSDEVRHRIGNGSNNLTSWWARYCLKHVEDCNKHIKNLCIELVII